MTRKTFTFNGFGFPIRLVNFPMADSPYGEVLDTNMVELERRVFAALIRKPSRLSGAEVKFMRHHLDMTQEALASELGVERSTVAQWERKDLEPTGMIPPAEFMLRTLALHRLTGRRVPRPIRFEVMQRHVLRQNGVGEPISLKVANG